LWKAEYCFLHPERDRKIDIMPGYNALHVGFIFVFQTLASRLSSGRVQWTTGVPSVEICGSNRWTASIASPDVWRHVTMTDVTPRNLYTPAARCGHTSPPYSLCFTYVMATRDIDVWSGPQLH